MEWYQMTTSFVQSLCPSIRETRRRNLALLTYGILKKRSLCPSVIVRAFPLKTTHHHRKKRLQRFEDNEAISPLTLIPSLAPKVCRLFGLQAKWVPIGIDWTPDQEGENCFIVSIPYRGRALPLLGWHLNPEDITSSQNELEEILTRRIIEALPETAIPVILADRGFGRASFLLFLKELERKLRREVKFVVRLPGKAKVEWGGKKFLLKDFPLERGKVYWLPGALYREDGVVRVNLVLFWDWGMEEPWYLATELSLPKQAIKWYSKRMQEEEGIRDKKGRLGMRGWKKVKDSSRKDKLLLGLILAYLVLALIAVKALPEGFAKQVISWGKGSFIFLALEWLEITPEPPLELCFLLEGR